MRIALVDTRKRQDPYQVALLKIGAWRKSLGDQVALCGSKLPRPGEYDEIWISTCFTFEIPRALGFVVEAKKRAPVVKVGGIAVSLLPEHFEKYDVEIHHGLIPEAEQFAPDYSLLPEPPNYSITHTSRGCIRKCKFCMVPRLEPDFYSREWEQDLFPSAKHILFYDNNWLAKPKDELASDIETIGRLVKSGQVVGVDFNQALDCRLMNEELADMLANVPLRPVRFSFDGMQEDGYCQNAIEMMMRRGFKSYMIYALYNFMDTPEDFYYRMKELVRLAVEHKNGIDVFPMRYQPILEVDAKREYVGKHWTAHQLKGFAVIKSLSSGRSGTVSPHAFDYFQPLDEFEYWYGKTPEDFVSIISYPKARELAEKKAGAVRAMRVKARQQ